MSRRAYRPNTSALVEAAKARGYIVVRSVNADAAYDYFAAARDVGYPVVIATLPRTSAEIEWFSIEHHHINEEAMAQIGRYIELGMEGSVATKAKRYVSIKSDAGVIRGVHEKHVKALCSLIAEVIRDPKSYKQKIVELFPATNEGQAS